MNYAIECYAIKKKYGRLTAVDGLSLKVAPGELFGFLGPNGAGKSTLIKILVGLVQPTSGWAQVAGFTSGHKESKRCIGYLPELFRFPSWMTGAELLDFHGRLIGLERSERRRRSLECLELTELTEAADRKIGTYSKGMQQRIGLAQAILGRPAVLFLDEPASALDPVGRARVRGLLEHVSGEGTAVFLNSHLLTDVERICARVAIVNKGRVVREGPPAALSGRLSLYLLLDEAPHELLVELGKRFGEVFKDNGRPELRITLDNGDAAPDIAEFLVHRGRRIFELRRETDSLEQTFFEAVGEAAEE